MSANDAPPLARPQPSRFASTLLDVLDTVQYGRIRPEDIDDPVYRLRYQAYRREDFLPYNSEEIYTDPLDRSPNAYCFGVYIDGRLAASLRIHHLTPGCRLSPSLGVYEDILGPMLDGGLTFIDPTRFTADHDMSLAYPALPYITLRLALMASEYFGVDYCLSSVRPEHAAFYRRVFQAQELGPLRGYDGLTFPIVMMATNKVAIPKILARFPFFASTPAERSALFGLDRVPAFGERVRASARAVWQDNRADDLEVEAAE